jgi:hypothetical protein
MVVRIKTEKIPGTVTVNGGLDVVIAETAVLGEFGYC